MFRFDRYSPTTNRGEASPLAKPYGRIAFGLKSIGLALLIYFTTSNVLVRIEALWTWAAYFPLIFFFAIWALCVAALVIAAFQPNVWLRCLWAVPLGLAGALAFTYRHFTETDLSPQEILSLWQARHEAGRALAFYDSAVPIGLAVFAASFIAIVTPPALLHSRIRSKSAAWAWTPLLPIIAISCVLIVKNGTSYTGFPPQFSLFPIAAYSLDKIARSTIEPRNNVLLAPTGPSVDHVLLLVDESIRADYISLDKSSPLTPELADHAKDIIDFGPTASGANCSNNSNAILRFTAVRNDLTKSVKTNPSLFSYAQQAGYRTVYIDAQAPRIKDTSLGSRFQNFMTFSEARSIDQIYFPDQNLPTPELDLYLLEVVEKEFLKPGKVFIYANKNGAHVPYNADYPRTSLDGGEKGTKLDVLNAEYRKAVRWNVGHFFGQFFTRVNRGGSATLYTSDHGQSLDLNKVTHCVDENPDPRQGYVPLMAIVDDDKLNIRLRQAAERNFAKTSHFEVAPTILEWMGYNASELSELFGTSLFKSLPSVAAFTSGDIFGTLGQAVRWNTVDLSADYLESSAKAAIEHHRVSQRRSQAQTSVLNGSGEAASQQ